MATVLHPCRRSLSYGIASAATCAPSERGYLRAVPSRTAVRPGRATPLSGTATGGQGRRDGPQFRAGREPGRTTGIARIDQAIEIRGGVRMRKSRIGALLSVSRPHNRGVHDAGRRYAGAVGGTNRRGGAPSGDTSKGTVKIAFELPMQGCERAGSQPIINGARLALKEAGGAAGGYAVERRGRLVFDDRVNGKSRPADRARRT